MENTSAKVLLGLRIPEILYDIFCQDALQNQLTLYHGSVP